MPQWVANVFGFLMLASLPAFYFAGRYFWPLMVAYARCYDAAKGITVEDDEPHGEFAQLYLVYRYHYASLRKPHLNPVVESARQRALPWYRFLQTIGIGFICCGVIFFLLTG